MLTCPTFRRSLSSRDSHFLPEGQRPPSCHLPAFSLPLSTRKRPHSASLPPPTTACVLSLSGTPFTCRQ
eukprot:3366133-Rhodomonas_salina.3